MKITTDVNLNGHDDIYEALIAMHEDLSEEESRRLNAQLILVLINQIGDADIIRDAIALVQRNRTAQKVTETQ